MGLIEDSSRLETQYAKDMTRLQTLLEATRNDIRELKETVSGLINKQDGLCISCRTGVAFEEYKKVEANIIQDIKEEYSESIKQLWSVTLLIIAAFIAAFFMLFSKN